MNTNETTAPVTVPLQRRVNAAIAEIAAIAGQLSLFGHEHYAAAMVAALPNAKMKDAHTNT